MKQALDKNVNGLVLILIKKARKFKDGKLQNKVKKEFILIFDKHFIQ